MALVYSILLLSLVSLTIVHAGSICNDEIDAVKCCKQPKKLDCVFMTPEEQAKNENCHCIPKHPSATPEEGNLCSWTPNPHLTTGGGKVIPCYGFYEQCADATKEIPRESCQIGYPPSSLIMGEHVQYHCKFGTKLPNIYDVFFTCWLFDCEHRLKIPQATKELGGTKWCYPPVLKDPKLKFCDKYTVDAETNYYDIVNPTSSSGCVLLPLCKDGADSVDANEYVAAHSDVDKSMDPRRCEKLCDSEGNNDGDYDKDGKSTCRVIPSCRMGSTNKTDPEYNKFQVPHCLPWCMTEEESRVRSSARKLRGNQRYCNPKPICDGNGTTPLPLYGQSNPYAAKGKNCIPKRDCKEDEKSTTHFCDDVPSDAKPTEPKPAGMSGTMIGLIAGGVLLIFIIIGIGLFFFIRRKKEKSVNPVKSVSGSADVKDGCIQKKVVDETTTQKKLNTPGTPSLNKMTPEGTSQKNTTPEADSQKKASAEGASQKKASAEGGSQKKKSPEGASDSNPKKTTVLEEIVACRKKQSELEREEDRVAKEIINMKIQKQKMLLEAEKAAKDAKGSKDVTSSKRAAKVDQSDKGQSSSRKK